MMVTTEDLSDEPLNRADISFTLKLISDLHIGHERVLRQPVSEPGGDANFSKDTVDTSDEHGIVECIYAADGRPFLPGSSLRGLIVRSIQQRSDNLQYRQPELASKLMQLLGSTALSSTLSVTDALQTDSEVETSMVLSRRTAIDPITATGAHSQLFSKRKVGPGALFNCRIRLRKPSGDPIEFTVLREVVAALSAFNVEPLGADKSVGSGVLKIADSITVRSLSVKGFESWLQQPDTPSLESYYQSNSFQPDVNYPGAFVALPLTLVPIEPVLVNDPNLVAKRQNEAENGTVVAAKNTDHKSLGRNHQSVADLIASRRVSTTNSPDQCLIPGSSIKGVCKAAIRRIANTMPDTDTPQILRDFFGDTEDGAGYLRFHDAYGAISSTEVRVMTKVDRHTGITTPFIAEALWVDTFHTTLAVNLNRFDASNNPLYVALLLFLFRDLLEQDIDVGWGTNRGFGKLYGYLGKTDPHTDNPASAWSGVAQQLLEFLYADSTPPSVEQFSEMLSRQLHAFSDSEAGA